MNRDPQEIYNAWLAHPDQRMMVIDEVRFPAAKTGVAGERLIYIVVCLRASGVVSIIHETDDYRATLPEQDRRRKLKAKNIFTKPSYKQFRRVIALALVQSEFVQRYATSSQYLLNVDKTALGPAARLTDGTEVDGHEFRMLQLIVKHAANVWGAGSEHVEVIVDRSSQLGMTLRQRGKDGQEVGFESFHVSAGALNVTSAGVPAETISDATFTIYAVGEETPQFGDALLLADSAGYLTYRATGPELGDAKLNDGVVFFPALSGRSFFDSRGVELNGEVVPTSHGDEHPAGPADPAESRTGRNATPNGSRVAGQ